MTVDQVDSRKSPDAVPELLELLGDVPVLLPFERMAGDEVQGVFEDSRAVVSAWESAARDGRWSVGIGLGAGGELGSSSRASRGAPFLAARKAVDEAKSVVGRVAVHVAEDAPAAARNAASAAQSVLRLLAAILDSRSDAGWKVIDAARAAPEATQAELAKTLGVSRQAVSKALRTHDARAVDDGLTTAAALLEESHRRIRSGGGHDR